MKALEEFAKDSNLDPELHSQIKNFMLNNYLELFARMDEETLINELPPTLKEELFFHQYGGLIDHLNFLQDLGNDCVWGIVKALKKINYEKGDTIYLDGDLSEHLFIIHKGTVKLYADNGYPFSQYKSGMHFGDADLLCGTRRNGTAKASEDCLLYKIEKGKLEDILGDFPSMRIKLVTKAIKDN